MRAVTIALIAVHALNLLGLACAADAAAGHWSMLGAAVFEHGRVARWLIAALLTGCGLLAALHASRGRRWLWWTAVFICASLIMAVVELPSTLSPASVVHIQLLQMAMAAAALGVLLQSVERRGLRLTAALQKPRRAAIVLVGASGGIITASVIATMFDASSTTGRLFDLDGEGNIASWFSSMLLAGAAATSALMTPFDRRRAVRRLWLVLAGLFTFVSFDEYAALHELPMLELIERQDLGWTLILPWATLLAAAAGIVALLCVSGLMRLRPATAARLVACGGVYLAGAIGLELLGGWWLERHGADAWHTALVNGEEALELLGVAAFIVVTGAELRAAGMHYVFGRHSVDARPLAIGEPAIRQRSRAA